MSKPSMPMMMELSTGNLTLATRRLLERERHGRLPEDDPLFGLTFVPWFEYGWILWIDADEPPPAHFPADLIECIGYARNEEADYLKFDCDAEVCDDLPVYGD